MGVYIQLKDKLYKLSSVEKWDELQDKPEIMDDSSDTFYIADPNGNVIARVDKDGIHATELTLGDTSETAVKVKEHIKDGVKHITADERTKWNNKSDLPNIIDDESAEFYLTDKDGNIIFKVSKDGIHSTEVTITDGKVSELIEAVKKSLTTHTDDKENPHEVTAEQVGLGKVDNTADKDKPVSTAQQMALDTLQKAMSEQIVSESEEWHVVDNNGNIVATINKEGVHTTEVVLPGGKVSELISNHTGDKANPHGVTKAQVGLGEVDNTSDADKPVSTAQGTAIGAVQSNLDSHTGDNNIHITAEERTKWNEGIGGSTLNVISLAGSATSGTFTDDVYALITSDPKSCVIKYGDTPSYYLYFSLYINVSGGIYEYRNTLTGMECKIQITSSKTWTYTTTNYVPATGGTFTGNVTVEGDFVANYVAGKFGLYAGDMHTEDGTYTVYAENHISIVTIENGVGSSKMFMLPSKSCTLGGQLYRHNLLVKSAESSNYGYAWLTIVSNQAEAYTLDTLKTFLSDNTCRGSWSTNIWGLAPVYPANGVVRPSGATTGTGICAGLIYDNTSGEVCIIGFVDETGGAGTYAVVGTVMDSVVEM